MSLLEVVPDNVLPPAKFERFLYWLVMFSVPPKIKKEILVDFMKEYDVKLERWMVEYIGAGEI